MSGFSDKNIRENSFAYRFSCQFENTFLSTIGAQSITISIKYARLMYCFLCGNKTVEEKSLKSFSVPICGKCESNSLSGFYLKKNKPIYGSPYIINPPIKSPTQQTCVFCNREYKTDPLFEDFGFTKKACKHCLKNSGINILLSNKHVMPIWRKRKQTS